MADTSDLVMGKPKSALIYGTLIGFIMIYGIIIISILMNSPLHNHLVCNKFAFWHSFASKPIVIAELTLATSSVPRNFFLGGGGFQQSQLRTEDRENEDLGAVAP
jgi:hypothetical protein